MILVHLKVRFLNLSRNDKLFPVFIVLALRDGEGAHGDVQGS